MLQAEVSRAEAAASAPGASLLLDVPDLLAPLIQHAKTQLHLHIVTEALHRTSAAAHTTAELPKLESAIQAARKAGLEELLPEPCRSESYSHTCCHRPCVSATAVSSEASLQRFAIHIHPIVVAKAVFMSDRQK